MSPRPKSLGPSVPRPPKRDKHGFTTRWRGAIHADTGKRPNYRKTWRFDVAPTQEVADRLYHAWLNQWENDPEISDPRRQVDEPNTLLIASQKYVNYAKVTFVAGGEPTSHVYRIKHALEQLCVIEDDDGRLLGNLHPDHVTLPLLAKYRDANQKREDGSPRARNSVNDMLFVVCEAFSWFAERGLVDQGAPATLAKVQRLKRGRSGAAERRKVKSAPRSRVDPILPLVPKPVAAIIELLWMTGMRPTEGCLLRNDRIDRSLSHWLYFPERYKGQHREDHGSRIIVIPPAAQRFIEPWIKFQLSGYLYRPTGNTAHREHYTSNSLRQAITRACERVWPVPADLTDKIMRRQWKKEHWWTPHQLRHARATEIYREHGHQAASEALGHKGTAPKVTLVYVDDDVLTQERIDQAIALEKQLRQPA